MKNSKKVYTYYRCKKCKRNFASKEDLSNHKKCHKIENILDGKSKTLKVFEFIISNPGLVAYKIGFMNHPNFNVAIRNAKIIPNKIKTKWYRPVNEYIKILKENNLIFDEDVKNPGKRYKRSPKKIYPNFSTLLDYLNIKYDYIYKYDKFLLEDEYKYLKNLFERHSDKLFSNSTNFLEDFVRIAFKFVEIKRGVWNVNSEQLDAFGCLVKDKNFKRNFYKELYEPKKHVFDLSAIGEPKNEKTFFIPKYNFHSNIKTMLNVLKKLDKAFEKRDYDTVHRMIGFILSKENECMTKNLPGFMYRLLMDSSYQEELKGLASN